EWALANGYTDQDSSVIPREKDNIHTDDNSLSISLQDIDSDSAYDLNDTVTIGVSSSGRYSLLQASLYVNGVFIETRNSQPFLFRFSPRGVPNIREVNEVRVVGQDSIYNRAEATATLRVELDG